MNIKNVVVIGSGTMGSGIAAQLCNANIPVTLLDDDFEEGTNQLSTVLADDIFETLDPFVFQMQ